MGRHILMLVWLTNVIRFPSSVKANVLAKVLVLVTDPGASRTTQGVFLLPLHKQVKKQLLMVAFRYARIITRTIYPTHTTDSFMLDLKLGHNVFADKIFHQAYYFLLMNVIGVPVKELKMEMTVHAEDIGN